MSFVMFCSYTAVIPILLFHMVTYEQKTMDSQTEGSLVCLAPNLPPKAGEEEQLEKQDQFLLQQLSSPSLSAERLLSQQS